MSYARRSAESDVYLYHDGKRFVCDTCTLNDGGNHTEVSVEAYLAHLRAHTAAGDKVPAKAYKVDE
jgi:hypothetical protein